MKKFNRKNDDLIYQLKNYFENKKKKLHLKNRFFFPMHAFITKNDRPSPFGTNSCDSHALSTYQDAPPSAMHHALNCFSPLQSFKAHVHVQ